MQHSNPIIWIVIPVYKEEDSIHILYKEIRTSVNQLKRPYEMIFVDDGSSDSTFERLKNIKKEETLSPTRIIRFSHNFGQIFTTTIQLISRP